MKKLLPLGILLLVIFIFGSISIYQHLSSSAPLPQPVSKEILTPKIIITTTSTSASSSGQIVPSRQWMTIAEHIVVIKKLPPPTAARLYAYTATVYYEVLSLTHDQEFANAATKSLLMHMYPDTPIDQEVIRTFKNNFNPTAYQYLYATQTPTLNIPTSTLNFLDPSHRTALEWLEKLFLRERSDGFYKPEKTRIPSGENWKNLSPLVTPEAGTWQRWIISSTTNFSTPSPPASGSKPYQDEVQKLLTLTAGRTSEQEELIQKWLTSDDTVTASGLWQDTLWQAAKPLSSSTINEAIDLTYASKQKILAQGLADTYNIVWQIKFTYWRARPTMITSHLATFIPTPHSPSYLSEDVAVARTAAELLRTWFPDQQEFFLRNATQIREAVILAGINFELDSKEGFVLGQKIGEEMVKITQKN
jgi:hypothetical protein